MANPIEENAKKILISLFENNPDGNLQFDGKDIQEYTDLSPKEINNAIEYLDESGLINRQNYLGTLPFDFSSVYLNTRGIASYTKNGAGFVSPTHQKDLIAMIRRAIENKRKN